MKNPVAREVSSSVRRTQCRFDLLHQPLPPGSLRPAEKDEPADDDDRQPGLDRFRERRLGHAGQPRVFGLCGSIARALELAVRS